MAFLPLKNAELTHSVGGWGGREASHGGYRLFG